MSVNDLNETAVFSQTFRTYPGGAHVRWQTRPRPSDGIRTMAYFSPRGGEAFRQLQRTQLQLLGPFSMHGFCSTDLQGEYAGHRGLPSQSAKLYHLGIRGKVSRSAIADANETRDWRIYFEFAQALIRIARRLYGNEPLAVDLSETVYALDSTTVDLCLKLFPWA